MSRISRPVMWEAYFGESPTAECLCCSKPIRRDAPKHTAGGWARGHIIHAKDGGPDFIENIRPICEECNAKDKSSPTSYHYMVDNGVFTQAECDRKISYIKNLQLAALTNPLVLKCIGKTVAGERCANNRKGFRVVCGVHDEEQHIKVYENEIFSRMKKECMGKLQEARVINDLEAIKINKEALWGIKGVMCEP